VALFVVVVAVVLGARFFFKRPVDATLVMSFGAAPSIREATLVFTSSDERVVRELKLRFDHGAAVEERRPLRLLPGDYTVGARLLDETGKERNLTRSLSIRADGAYLLSFDK
jgi:hypothetical protein